MKAIILNHTASQIDIAQIPDDISKDYIKSYIEGLYDYDVIFDFMMLREGEPFGTPIFEAGYCSTSKFVDL